MKLRSLAPVALLAASGLAQAHPGHDTAPALGFLEGLAHLLTQPDHLAMVGSAVVVALAARRAWRSRRDAGRRVRR